MEDWQRAGQRATSKRRLTMNASGTKKGWHQDADKQEYCGKCWPQRVKIVRRKYGKRFVEHYIRGAEPINKKRVTGTVMCAGDNCTKILNVGA